jgi:enoyl-CoA hydratase/carnithine racemase
MTQLNDYQDAFDRLRFERINGILQITLHTDGGPFVFDETTHHRFGEAFRAVADDTENKVVILTGTGDRFCTHFDVQSFYDRRMADQSSYWTRIRRDGDTMLNSFLDIPVPVISAINGPAYTHSELPLLGDVVLAAESAEFKDSTHFIAGIPPGDGMHIVWTRLLGPNQGRAFLLTGQVLSAQEAQRRGVVAEVLPGEELLARAWELARAWVEMPPLNLINTKSMLAVDWKIAFATHLHTGLTYEAMADTSMKRPAPTVSVVDLAGGQD